MKGVFSLKSIKPGRGPSGMSFVGSIIAIVFGVFWTIMAASMTSNSPFPVVGTVFPLFGVLFIVLGIITAAYHYKNATGESRYSIFDITDSSEEGDPAEKWVKKSGSEYENNSNTMENDSGTMETKRSKANYNFCPYCGEQLKEDFTFCPKCVKLLS
jgi:hypothetical protein